MAPSSRDRLSVDLHGLKVALLERAQALGVSPSGLVRATLAEALAQPAPASTERSMARHLAWKGDRARLCLRMSRDHARLTLEASRRAGLNPGDYIGGLVAGVPVLSAGSGRLEHIAAMRASCAELATLSRNIHRLTALLRQANVEPAKPYRQMLDTLSGDVRSHLELASRALADLQPRSRSAGPEAHRTQ